ncbi:MAG: hypothetical protein NZO16_01640 [Deltaproteobacteria bacterium]|nr:hypothetical protein [Deltaproteobacteria bacterium]
MAKFIAGDPDNLTLFVVNCRKIAASKIRKFRNLVIARYNKKLETISRKYEAELTRLVEDLKNLRVSFSQSFEMSVKERAVELAIKVLSKYFNNLDDGNKNQLIRRKLQELMYSLELGISENDVRIKCGDQVFDFEVEKKLGDIRIKYSFLNEIRQTLEEVLV